MSKVCLVRFDSNRYSVAARAAQRPVEILANADRVDFRFDGELVGSHPRSFGRGETLYDWLHDLPVLERKPGALRDGAPFRAWELPGPIAEVRARLAKLADGNRQMVQILAMEPEADCGRYDALRDMPR